jgi:hypothetical protein
MTDVFALIIKEQAYPCGNVFGIFTNITEAVGILQSYFPKFETNKEEEMKFKIILEDDTLDVEFQPIELNKFTFNSLTGNCLSSPKQIQSKKNEDILIENAKNALLPLRLEMKKALDAKQYELWFNIESKINESLGLSSLEKPRWDFDSILELIIQITRDGDDYYNFGSKLEKYKDAEMFIDEYLSTATGEFSDLEAWKKLKKVLPSKKRILLNNMFKILDKWPLGHIVGVISGNNGVKYSQKQFFYNCIKTHDILSHDIIEWLDIYYPDDKPKWTPILEYFNLKQILKDLIERGEDSDLYWIMEPDVVKYLKDDMQIMLRTFYGKKEKI